jgi:hypothetical protein
VCVLRGSGALFFLGVGADSMGAAEAAAAAKRYGIQLRRGPLFRP